MKKFREFVLEANKFGIPNTEYIQWQRDRDAGVGPARKTFNGIEYQMRNKARAGQPKVWAVSPSSDRKASSEKRSQRERETELNKDELLGMAKKDLTEPNPEERSALALDAEKTQMKKIDKRVATIGRKTGIKQSKDHLQPLQRKTNNPENQQRLDKVLPGHTSSNLRIKPLSANSSKQNAPLKPGETGYTLTRSSAVRNALNRGDALGRRIDALVKKVRES